MFKSPICTLAFLLLLSCGRKAEQITPVKGKITESVYASGIVKSRNQYQVFATVSGLIQEIFVTEGDIVHKGDPLIRLVDAAARLNTERAQIAARYATLPANRDKLDELKTNIDAAKAKKEHDALLFSRQRTLWAQGIGTRNELDAVELADRTSASAYKASILRYNDMQKQLSLQALQAQNALQASSTAAGDYLIKSDVGGKVYSILKKKGELVNPQSPVALIGDAAGFMLELQVDEYDIARITAGQRVFINMDSYKGQVFEAVIEKINPSMNPQSRSFTIDAAFSKTPAVLYPNLTVEANIIIQVKENALTIPRAYLMDDNYVLLASGEKRKVITGLKDYQRVEIRSGLTANDVIVKPVP